jgi:type II secretion system protein H
MNSVLRGNRKNIPHQAGFTLVEIMMVIMLIGLLAGISAPPLFRYLQSSQLQTSTDRMVADLQYARTLAISNGTVLRFTATTTGYNLINPNTGVTLRGRTFDGSMKLEQDQTIDFFPWGMANAMTFQLSSCGEMRQINVLPTGMVEVP